MKRYNNPKNWEQLLQRPQLTAENLDDVVKKVLKEVQEKGDGAIRKYTQQFDQVELEDSKVSQIEIEAAIQAVSPALKSAIEQATSNIKTFHKAQKDRVDIIETQEGITCWRKSVGIDKVGLYIPGGTAPLFSTVLMLGIPAKIAGCQEIVLCTPPQKDGSIHPAILFAANLVGCTQIFKIGGVQAIGAMAYGTETVPKVYKIFGPGNQYVTCAKQQVSQAGIAIDMPAGPSELLVWADENADPTFVAADLLSQAEHGADSQVVLVSTNAAILDQVETAIQTQIKTLPRKNIAAKALENSFSILLETNEEALDFINAYAPEHLILNFKEADDYANKITNAGSVFLGNYTPESLGDYASGTNHTLPTNGYAKSFSALSLDAFVKKITFQKATAQGLLNIAKIVEEMAAAEQLEAHKQAVSIRVKSLQQTKAL